MQVLKPDGRWNPASASGWRDASPVGTRTDADVAVLNIFATTLADTAIGGLVNWPLRSNAAGRYLRAGQGVEIVTGGTLGFVDISVRRTGAVATGNIWAEIYSQDANGLADTLLATSNVRAASAAPTTMGAFRFTFSGGAQIVLAAGQDIVVVLNGDYPVSATQNVGIGWNRAGYAPGTFQLDGTGVSFDDQNYPMQDSFRTIPASPGFIVWIAPTFFTGVDYDTPNFAALLQTLILGGSYSQGDPLGFGVSRSNFLFPGSTAQRQWAQFSHPTFGPVRLIVEWEERIIPQPDEVSRMVPRLDATVILPLMDPAEVLPRLDAATVEPQLEVLSVLPRLDSSDAEPQLQPFSVLPRLDSTPVLPQTAEVAILPKLVRRVLLPQLDVRTLVPKV